eukprot:6182713-Pleurochrysis_carterae.AAC.1
MAEDACKRVVAGGGAGAGRSRCCREVRTRRGRCIRSASGGSASRTTTQGRRAGRERGPAQGPGQLSSVASERSEHPRRSGGGSGAQCGRVGTDGTPWSDGGGRVIGSGAVLRSNTMAAN